MASLATKAEVGQRAYTLDVVWWVNHVLDCFRMCVMISRQFRMLREILGCCKKNPMMLNDVFWRLWCLVALYDALGFFHHGSNVIGRHGLDFQLTTGSTWGICRCFEKTCGGNPRCSWSNPLVWGETLRQTRDSSGKIMVILSPTGLPQPHSAAPAGCQRWSPATTTGSLIFSIHFSCSMIMTIE